MITIHFERAQSVTREQRGDVPLSEAIDRVRRLYGADPNWSGLLGLTSIKPKWFGKPGELTKQALVA